jgi:hypothetical protein
MLLPNGDRAIVDSAKLRDYCLSTVHPRGKHKARRFEAIFGWTADNWQDLRNTLLEAARTADALLTRQTEHGAFYEQTVGLRGPNGFGTVQIVWIVGAGTEIPRLVTCYPL